MNIVPHYVGRRVKFSSEHVFLNELVIRSCAASFCFLKLASREMQMRTLAWTWTLLLIVIYLFAVFGTRMIGHA